MRFTDDLKMNFRTKGEVLAKEKRESILRAEKFAISIFEIIKARLISAAANGEYDMEQGEKIVSYIYPLPDEFQHYLALDKKDTSIPAVPNLLERSMSQMVGKSKQECRRILRHNKGMDLFSGGKPAERHCCYTFFICKEADEFKYFFDKLQNNAAMDGISVELCIWDSFHATMHHLPATIKDEWRDKTHYKLSVKCSCIIPEKYSTEEPVAIAIEQSTEREDISEAIEQSVGCKETAKPQIGTIHDKLQISLITSSNRTIKVRWNKLDNVVRYDLFRADGNKPLERLCGIDKESVLFSDRKLKSKRQYYYQLVAVIDDGIHREYKVSSTIATIKAGVMQKQQSVAESTKISEQISFDNMEGHEFERFCAQLLRENGYERVTVTKESGDQGIDIIAYKDGVKFGFQCKCYATDIGNKAVQEAYSGKAYYNCHVGVVLTNRYFTRSAVELAQKNGILLWDRSKLLKLMQGADI